MIRKGTRENPNDDPHIDAVTTSGSYDYVKDGVFYKNLSGQSVLVESEGDLENMSAYPPGTLAYTAGYAKIWHKAADGTWAEAGGEDGQ